MRQRTTTVVVTVVQMVAAGVLLTACSGQDPDVLGSQQDQLGAVNQVDAAPSPTLTTTAQVSRCKDLVAMPAADRQAVLTQLLTDLRAGDGAAPADSQTQLGWDEQITSSCTLKPGHDLVSTALTWYSANGSPFAP